MSVQVLRGSEPRDHKARLNDGKTPESAHLDEQGSLKLELIEQINERVRDRLEPERAAAAERFVLQFFRHVPPDDLREESADNLYGASMRLWRFVQRREPGQAKVRVYNPRPESHGWKSPHTIIEIVNDDMPFLVDSVVAAVQEVNGEVHLVIHPVLRLKRDAEGRFVELHGAGPEAKTVPAESVMHLQIDEQPTALHGAIQERINATLQDVRASVDDFPLMLERCRQEIARLKAEPPALHEDEIAEGIAFLEWIADENFTFLGYREYAFEGEGDEETATVLNDSGLGVVRDSEVTLFEKVRSLGPMPEKALGFLRRPELLIISKANRRSTVHRPVHMDAIAVKLVDDDGKVTGQRLFVGLFTSTAYSGSVRRIPLLRRKVTNTIARSGFDEGSHDAKALLHVLESYPRDELFQITEERLFEIATGIVHLQERQRTALFCRLDPFERFASCLVFVPRERYDTSLRLRFSEILCSAFRGTLAAFYTHLTDSALARLHLIIKTNPGETPADLDLDLIEQQLIEAARSWSDRLRESLIEEHREERGLAYLRRYENAFPRSYQDQFNEQSAVFDIGCIEKSLETGTLALNLFRPVEAGERELRLKIYIGAAPPPLSDVLPLLEDMGLRVIDEIPYAVHPAGVAEPVWIRDFFMRAEEGCKSELEQIRDDFHEALSRVWRGEMESDGFNRLVLCARLSAREVTLLRAYCKYLLQARIPFSQSYMESTLVSNPTITRLLVNLFRRRFDPSISDSKRRCEELSAQIEDQLESVEHLDEDRIIRRFRNVIESTVRTNYFQTDDSGAPKPYMSFKLDSQKVQRLPKPVPFREIFVYSNRVEAVHLRGGRVARGGLRWSDRREDFRTEVLGLMKAQMVKNAVIVPVGSKGGFIVKKPADGDRERVMAEVVECYKTMIRGMLDVTDNLIDGAVEPPTAVVRHDQDDPYLVVAADKGTATFSDIANEVSAEYGFWLDDAFASGGSAGYDHKKLGITARGAWESVKRHFRELGKDTQKEDFTVVGCGDMSGDVFGNGMLLSKHVQLVGAFNHLHIFVDPEPDVEASFAERKRLFELPRSSWADYDSERISAGGGVFDRSAKAIEISEQMAQRFGIDESTVTPNELIQRMLRSEVELLWFGGIGTYVKASREAQAEVGDRANDALRIDASDVRARVIGEGANLAITQRGRVELGLLGVRLNTDSIDNAAGVNTSDHEVNIKILLSELESAGDLTRKQRDRTLDEMAEEVAALVLRDNYLQTQAITVTHQLGARLNDRTARLIRRLQKSGRLDRRLEFLPDEETIVERAQQGIGFTRPEIAVLLSYAKMELYEQLLADLPVETFLEHELRRYFPTALRERYGGQIAEHQLRREITATQLTNDIVNRVGITYLHEVMERTGRAPTDIARAYLISREIFRMRDLWERIEALDLRAPATVQATMLAECGRLLERSTVWFLREEQQPLDVSTQIERYRDGVQEVVLSLSSLLSESDRRLLHERSSAYRDAGAPEEEARMAASLPVLAPAADIVRIGHEHSVPVERAGEIYFGVGTRFGVDWLRRTVIQLPTDTAWDKLAVTAMVDDLFGHQSQLTRRIIESAGNGLVSCGAIDRWADERRAILARTEQLLAELQTVASPSLAMLAVATQQLKSLSS